MFLSFMPTRFVANKIIDFFRMLVKRTDNSIDDSIVDIISFLVNDLMCGDYKEETIGNLLCVVLSVLASKTDNEVDDKIVEKIEKILKDKNAL